MQPSSQTFDRHAYGRDGRHCTLRLTSFNINTHTNTSAADDSCDGAAAGGIAVGGTSIDALAGGSGINAAVIKDSGLGSNKISRTFLMNPIS